MRKNTVGGLCRDRHSPWINFGGSVNLSLCRKMASPPPWSGPPGRPLSHVNAPKRILSARDPGKENGERPGDEVRCKPAGPCWLPGKLKRVARSLLVRSPEPETDAVVDQDHVGDPCQPKHPWGPGAYLRLEILLLLEPEDDLDIKLMAPETAYRLVKS